jgi:hypothetical protein
MKRFQRQKVKKATRLDQQGAYPSKTLMPNLNRKNNWLRRSLSSRTQRQKPKKLQIWRVFGPKRAGALLPRAKSVITLCVGLQEVPALW